MNSAKSIVRILEQLGLETQLGLDRGGQRIDVVAKTPSGAEISILVKQWRRLDETMLQKAVKEADLLLTQSDHGLIVIPSLPTDQRTEAVRNLSGLPEAVQQMVASEPILKFRGSSSKPERIAADKKMKRIFVAMPFADHFEDTYYLAILPAAERVSASCVRLRSDLTKMLQMALSDDEHSEMQSEKNGE